MLSASQANEADILQNKVIYFVEGVAVKSTLHISFDLAPAMPTDARFDRSLFNDTFDFSRYPVFKMRHTSSSTTPCEPKDRGKTPQLATSWRSGNVSEPHLIYSTNSMRESWFTDLASARTVGDIVELSTTTVVESPCARAWCDAVEDNPQKATYEDSCNHSGHMRPGDDKGEDDSFYSMDSADQDVHPLLLSMPIVPQIKLERKATVRKPDPGPSLVTAQNPSFLSPRIWDPRTPARMSSRRYGCILAKSHVRCTFNYQVSKRFGSTSWSEHMKNSVTEMTHILSASEPALNSPNTSDDEKACLLRKEVDDSRHSDTLFSIVNEIRSPHGSYSDSPSSGIDEPFGLGEVRPKHPKQSHQRSFVNHSLSFSSLIHAVVAGYASLDLLRKRKARPNLTLNLKFHEHVGPNVHDPASKWAPTEGQIIIKVFVPSTDDIWMFRVPQDINLADFKSRVVTKLGFAVSFSGSVWDEPKYYFVTDEQFKAWVKGRIRFGRNLPIVAHVLPPLPLVKLSVDGDGCEVWCYA